MVVTTGLLFWNWSLDAFSWPLFLWACYMGIATSVMSHNHNHLGMWKSKALNVFQNYWITLFYGFPTFAWIPTHNQNHHKFNNREGDDTKTWRFSEKNTLLTMLTYPTISAFYQQKPVAGYLKGLWAKKDKRRFIQAAGQYVALALFIGTALFLDWKKALLFIVIPQQVGLFAVLVFNYLQHVHADELSEWNHSRNITGFWLNALLFNNGFHTVHHMQPGLHWSKTRAAHEKVAHNIDPVLEEKTVAWMLLRMFIVAPFSKKYRNRSLRLERMAREAAAAAQQEKAAPMADDVAMPLAS